MCHFHLRNIGLAQRLKPGTNGKKFIPGYQFGRFELLYDERLGENDSTGRGSHDHLAVINRVVLVIAY